MEKRLDILDDFYDLAIQNSDISHTAMQLANEYPVINKYDVKKAATELINSQKVSGKIEPFDRNSVGMVAKRAV